MKKRIILILIYVTLTLVLCLGLVACGNSASTASATSTVVTATPIVEKDKVTINLASVYTIEHPFGLAIDQILTKFTKDNPEVTIERQFSPAEELSRKLAIQLASNSLPEVFVLFPGADNVGKYSAAAIDLTDVLNSDQNWNDGFISGSLNNYKVDGKAGIYAAPLGAYCVGFYYNVDMFQKAGTQPPQTWTQLLDVIQKLQTIGVTPWALGAKDSWRAEHLATNIFYKLNGVAATKDLANRKLAYDSPSYIDMYKAMVSLTDAGAFGKSFIGMDYVGEIEAFNNETAAMRMSGSWTVGETTGKDAPAAIKEKVGFFQFPYFEGKEENKDAWMGGTSDAFAVSSNVKGYKKEMSINLVKVLTSSESSKLITESAHDLTAVRADVDPAKSGTLLAEVSKSMGTGKSFGGDFVGYEKDLAVSKKAYELCQAVLIKMVTPEVAAKQILDEIKKSSK